MKNTKKKLPLNKLNKVNRSYDVKTLGCNTCSFCHTATASVGLLKVDHN